MLATYLRDHHAGATTGVALAHRAARTFGDDPNGAEIARAAEEIAQDRAVLERVMHELQITPSRLKDGLARVAEVGSRLKLNNRLVHPSPLSRVVELEALVMGITGKIALWEALDAVPGLTIADVDFSLLAARGLDQRARVDAVRRRVAVDALRAD